MSKNFLANPPATDTATQTVPVAEPPPPDREPVKILLIGSPKAVRSIIHILYCLGFASVSEWSPLQPAQKPGEVMSILMRYLRL
ncbi:peptide ABC transporter substrate-binding protein [Microcoleus sp. B5-D4]|uniref:peptide ABC transporter substrate-binding protein n=1 Tax=unclassified Microcoleus TaxID=2642155 RepID=UPI002FD27207